MGRPCCKSFQPRRNLWNLWVRDFWYCRGLWRSQHERRGSVKIPPFGHRGRNLMGGRKVFSDETFIPRILDWRRRPFVSHTWFRRRTMLIEGQGTIYHLMMVTLRRPLKMLFFMFLLHFVGGSEATRKRIIRFWTWRRDINERWFLRLG